MFIDSGNSVWFHDHAEGQPCNPNCYAHVDSPKMKGPALWFIRIDGTLRQVYPITKPSKNSEPGMVIVEVSRTREIRQVHNTELILDY